MKKYKNIFIIIFLVSISFFLFHHNVLAVDSLLDKVGQQDGVPKGNLMKIIASLVKTLLGFLGLILLALFLYSGFEWMTAGGDDKKVESAKTRLKNAIIGLAIILASYAIANFVITKLTESISNTSTSYNILFLLKK